MIRQAGPDQARQVVKPDLNVGPYHSGGVPERVFERVHFGEKVRGWRKSIMITQRANS